MEEEKKLIEEKQPSETEEKEKNHFFITIGPFKIELNEIIDFIVVFISFILLTFSYNKYFPSVITIYPLIISFWNSISDRNHLFKHVFVSAFFPIKEGVMRHPLWHYKKRANLLFDVFSPHETLYVFTPIEGKNFLLSEGNTSDILNDKKDVKIRTLKPNIKFITKYQSAYDISKIAKYKKSYEQIAELMNITEKYPVSAEIGAIWNSKLVIIEEVINNYEPTADLIFWVDIGLIKTDDFFKNNISFIWPSTKRIEKIFTFKNSIGEIKLRERIIFTNKKNCFKYNGGSPKAININKIEFVLAGFFGGERQTFKSFLKDYWVYHDLYLKRKQYVLREEKVISAYSIFNQDKVFFIHLRKCDCYIILSSLAFTSQYNLCNCTNSVYQLNVSKTRVCIYPINLDSWL